MAAAREPEMALDVTEQDDVEQGVSCAIEPGIGAVLPPVGQFASPGETGLRDSLPQLAALAELEQEILLQLLVDAGNADEKGRCDLADVERDRVDRFRKTDGAAQHELHHFGIA